MGLRDRLWNLARAELSAAGRRIRAAADRAWPDFETREPLDDSDWEPPPRSSGLDPELKRYYANLELREGASLVEVKAAYRRLVRRYHPDHHGGDPAATRITLELRTAYEALTRHLEAAESGRHRSP